MINESFHPDLKVKVNIQWWLIISNPHIGLLGLFMNLHPVYVYTQQQTKEN